MAPSAAAGGGGGAPNGCGGGGGGASAWLTEAPILHQIKSRTTAITVVFSLLTQ